MKVEEKIADYAVTKLSSQSGNLKWTTMGEIAEVIGGGTPRTSDASNFEGGDIPWITPADLSGYTEKYISHGARFITRKGLDTSSARVLPAGSVLFTSRAPIGYVAIARNPIATNQGFKSFVLKENILPEYVYWWLKGAKQAAEGLASGTTFLELSGANAKKLPIPIVSLEQQKQIVAEIEKQFSRLDEAVANLKRVKANLKRYKAAVLKAAVEGRLVETEAELARREGRSLPTPRPGVFYVYAIRCEDDSIYIGQTDNLARRWEEHLAGQAADWTKQHKPMQIVHYEEYSSRREAADREKWLKTGYGRKRIKREIEAGRVRQVGYETGEQLLQRILETRRSQWQGKGKYKEPTAPDTTDLPELPEGWVWASVDQLASDSLIGLDRGRDQQNSEGIGSPYVKMNNVTMEGDVTDVDMAYVNATDEDKHRFGLESGDMLFNTRNSKELVGKVGLVRAVTKGAIYNNNLMRIRLAKGAISSFICSQMCSDGFRRRMELVKKATTNVAAVYAKDLFPLQIALPPEQEQQRIVAEIDHRFSLIREVEAQVGANLQRAERLRQSILSKAFAGLIVQHVLPSTVMVVN
jgi:restriction endonuclease S subunit/predicted GIY-YIG superfamily endonuclease